MKIVWIHSCLSAAIDVWRIETSFTICQPIGLRWLALAKYNRLKLLRCEKLDVPYVYVLNAFSTL